MLKNLRTTARLGLWLTLAPLQAAALDLDVLEQFDAWLARAFQPGAMRSLEGVRSLGELESEITAPYLAGHSPGLQYRTMTFPGLQVAVVAGEDGTPFLIDTIKLLSDEWSLVNGVAVGQPVDQLLQLPVAANEDGAFCGVTHCLHVETQRGRISRLSLVYYLD